MEEQKTRDQKKGLMEVFKNKEETPIKKSDEALGTVSGVGQVTLGESMKSNNIVGAKQEDRKIQIGG